MSKSTRTHGYTRPKAQVLQRHDRATRDISEHRDELLKQFRSDNRIRPGLRLPKRPRFRIFAICNLAASVATCLSSVPTRTSQSVGLLIADLIVFESEARQLGGLIASLAVSAFVGSTRPLCPG